MRSGDIASALGGISHGIVDFAASSLHDIQTAMTYIGLEEVPVSERTLMIEAIEQSQSSQTATLEGWMQDLLSVDESDTAYHSFRAH